MNNKCIFKKVCAVVLATALFSSVSASATSGAAEAIQPQTNGFDGIKTAVTNIFNDIKETITDVFSSEEQEFDHFEAAQTKTEWNKDDIYALYKEGCTVGDVPEFAHFLI